MRYKAKININWPDDIWEQDAEEVYLEGCLELIIENIRKHSLHPDIPRQICNRLGRVIIEMEVKLCNS